jgi:hypothetical protein
MPIATMQDSDPRLKTLIPPFSGAGGVSVGFCPALVADTVSEMVRLELMVDVDIVKLSLLNVADVLDVMPEEEDDWDEVPPTGDVAVEGDCEDVVEVASTPPRTLDAAVVADNTPACEPVEGDSKELPWEPLGSDALAVPGSVEAAGEPEEELT